MSALFSAADTVCGQRQESPWEEARPSAAAHFKELPSASSYAPSSPPAATDPPQMPKLCLSSVIQIPAVPSSSDQMDPLLTDHKYCKLSETGSSDDNYGKAGSDLDDVWPEESRNVESDSGINESESTEPHDDSEADALECVPSFSSERPKRQGISPSVTQNI